MILASLILYEILIFLYDRIVIANPYYYLGINFVGLTVFISGPKRVLNTKGKEKDIQSKLGYYNSKYLFGFDEDPNFKQFSWQRVNQINPAVINVYVELMSDIYVNSSTKLFEMYYEYQRPIIDFPPESTYSVKGIKKILNKKSLNFGRRKGN